ncbi:MAG: ankyrin repeat domain-containing protein [Legionella sp.]|uniref:ankyrin repeat domain-containing protein n=1 Tax=Legionella sp. TaxID=459 RepID=UPI0039E47E98
MNVLGCLALLQGARNENHKLSALPLDLLIKIFDFTLQPEKTIEQRKGYIANILTAPIGSLFKTKPLDTEISMLIKKYKLADSSQESLEKRLRNAANNNYVEDFKLFIKHVKNINAQDNNPISRKTALQRATEKGHLDCVKLLLEAGAAPNIHELIEQLNPPTKLKSS